jgi:AraC-like DNA-binding protein
VRRTDTGAFYLAVNYFGVQELVLERQSVVLQPNDMVLLHSSQVMQTRVDPRASRLRSAMIPVDPAIVPGGVRSLQQLVGRPLSSRSGEVLLVAQHAYVLAAGRVHPGDMESLSSSALSLTALMLSRQLNTVDLLPVTVRRESMAVKVRSYIVANLADPGLSVETVAAVHHISVRTLQRLFHADGISVAAWIRRTRLDNCRKQIQDPAFADRPVSAIARCSGFTDASQFSRAYRAEFGESPTDTRDRGCD